ncbi:MAG: hypothetical protein ACI3ZB_10450 [Prevotella sp.]
MGTKWNSDRLPSSDGMLSRQKLRPYTQAAVPTLTRDTTRLAQLPSCWRATIAQCGT